jgi:hypothetical protein
MAGFLEYDAKRHEAEGDKYVEWLKSWNVDVDNMPELKDNKAATESQADNDSADEPDDDYDDWTAEQLRKELANRELSQSGNKAELIARLREDDADES